MAFEKELAARSGSICELCGSDLNLLPWQIPSSPSEGLEAHLLLCSTCRTQAEEADQLSSQHLRCLNDSIWSPVPAVQVISWRLLQRLKHKGEMWASDVLDMAYLDPEVLAWARAGGDADQSATQTIHRDANGNELQAGDNVVLVKTLNVKGTNLQAKKGTVVKNIRLDPENPDQVEGRIDGQMIVILTRYLKKSG